MCNLQCTQCSNGKFYATNNSFSCFAIDARDYYFETQRSAMLPTRCGIDRV